MSQNPDLINTEVNLIKRVKKHLENQASIANSNFDPETFPLIEGHGLLVVETGKSISFDQVGQVLFNDLLFKIDD